MSFLFHQLTQNIIDPLEHLILSISPNLKPDQHKETSLTAGWYLTPKQHALEFIVFNIVLIGSLYYFYKRFQTHRQHKYLEEYLEAIQKTSPITKEELTKNNLFDKLLVTLLFICLFATLIYKINKQSTLFMLQPCHVSVFLLLFVLGYSNQNHKMPHLVFNIILHISWGAMMALLFPDMRDYTQFLEVEIFWLEHFLIILVPIYCIYVKKFYVMPLSLSMALLSFFLIAVYHSLILASTAIVTGVNLNYLLAPPPGPLEKFGSWYRVVMYLGCLPVTLFTRFVLWGGIEWVFVWIRGITRERIVELKKQE